jgi:hypothetical protein
MKLECGRHSRGCEFLCCCPTQRPPYDLKRPLTGVLLLLLLHQRHTTQYPASVTHMSPHLSVGLALQQDCISSW